MKFIAFKTADGAHKGNISFYCRLLHVTRQGFYQYLVSKDRPWKYQELADAMMQIHAEDECNDTYGRIRMYQALKIKQPESIHVPSERTVYRIMEEIGLSHRPNHKPNGITKADRQAQMSEDLLHRDFHADTPLMRASLCVQMLDNAMISYPMLRGAILHSDRGSQYTSQLYREAIQHYGIRQSMNRTGGRCHDNARCESKNMNRII